MSGPTEPWASGRSIEDIEALLESVRPEDLERREPPADLWAAINAETTNDGSTLDDADDAFDGDLFEDTIAGSALEEKLADDTRHLTPVADIDQGRRGLRRTQVFGAIVAAAAAAAIILGVSVSGDNDPTNGQLASVELSYDVEAFDPLGADAAATAVLVEDNGSFLIRVDEADLPAMADDDDLELWLIQPDAAGNPADLISLGTVDVNDPGEFVIPATHDPDVFFVVDISVEPRDGDATHSGRSILRGALADI